MKSVSLKEVCDVFGDGDWIESKDQSDGGIRLIQTGNVGVGVFKDRIEKARWISEDTFKRLRCTEIREGDVLISRLPDPVGRSCLIPALEHKAITAVDCSILRFDPSKMNAKFFIYYSQSAQYANAIEPLISGSTRQRISREKLGTVQIPLPSLKVQQSVVEKLDSAFAEIDLLERNLDHSDEKANQLLQSLLSAAFPSNVVSVEPGNPSANQELVMKKEIRVWTLNDLILAGKVKLGRGNIISKKDIASFPGEYPIYSSAREKNGTFGYYGKYMFDEELITWSIDGGGRLFYRPHHKFSVTNVGGTLRILDNDFLDCRYLHLVLTHLHSKIRFDWVYKAHPSVIRMVYNEIPIPTLEKQREIVEKLDSAFAEIDLLKAQIKIEKDYATGLRQSLLSSAFTQEDAIA